LTISLGASLAIAPYLAGQNPRPSEQRERAREQAREERREQKREYHFRTEDQTRLREHYRVNFHDRDHIDIAHRPHFVAGGRLPADWKVRMHPVPEVVYHEFPPIPTGLQIGYLDGYAVVYDPLTMEIVET